jgi:hypothetical protein
MSLRDISTILKKHGVNHGIAMIDDDNNNKKSHSNNVKATQAYKLLLLPNNQDRSLLSITGIHRTRPKTKYFLLL